MAEITVKPSPGLGMCRRRKLSVVITLSVSLRRLAAATPNPLRLSISLIMFRTASSPLASRIPGTPFRFCLIAYMVHAYDIAHSTVVSGFLLTDWRSAAC
jgi:hypothetical protein